MVVVVFDSRCPQDLTLEERDRFDAFFFQAKFFLRRYAQLACAGALEPIGELITPATAAAAATEGELLHVLSPKKRNIEPADVDVVEAVVSSSNSRSGNRCGSDTGKLGWSFVAEGIRAALRLSSAKRHIGGGGGGGGGAPPTTSKKVGQTVIVVLASDLLFSAMPTPLLPAVGHEGAPGGHSPFDSFISACQAVANHGCSAQGAVGDTGGAVGVTPSTLLHIAFASPISWSHTAGEENNRLPLQRFESALHDTCAAGTRSHHDEAAAEARMQRDDAGGGGGGGGEGEGGLCLLQWTALQDIWARLEEAGVVDDVFLEIIDNTPKAFDTMLQERLRSHINTHCLDLHLPSPPGPSTAIPLSIRIKLQPTALRSDGRSNQIGPGLAAATSLEVVELSSVPQAFCHGSALLCTPATETSNMLFTSTCQYLVEWGLALVMKVDNPTSLLMEHWLFMPEEEGEREREGGGDRSEEGDASPSSCPTTPFSSSPSARGKKKQTPRRKRRTSALLVQLVPTESLLCLPIANDDSSDDDDDEDDDAFGQQEDRLELPAGGGQVRGVGGGESHRRGRRGGGGGLGEQEERAAVTASLAAMPACSFNPLSHPSGLFTAPTPPARCAPSFPAPAPRPPPVPGRKGGKPDETASSSGGRGRMVGDQSNNGSSSDRRGEPLTPIDRRAGPFLAGDAVEPPQMKQKHQDERKKKKKRPQAAVPKQQHGQQHGHHHGQHHGQEPVAGSGKQQLKLLVQSQSAPRKKKTKKGGSSSSSSSSGAGTSRFSL